MRTTAARLGLLLAVLLGSSGHADALHQLKPLDRQASLFPTVSDYMIVLERFPMHAEKGYHEGPQPGLGYFGNPDSLEQGQRPLANFIVCYALLSREPRYDPAVSGVSQETLRSHALAALRYMTRTYITGDLLCTDGKHWGNQWQSAYWTAHMSLGAYLLWPHLSADERTAVRRVLAYEANLLPRTDRSLVGMIDDTKSEENAWDTEGLSWALKLCPGHPDRGKWRAALDLLAMNTLTTVADASREAVVAGKPVEDWVQGANLHPDYTIENHGFFHICYMICPLHSFAWDYLCWNLPDISGEVDAAFAGYRSEAFPESLSFHVPEVWNRTKHYYLYDGRFAYVGGKDWPRYAYGLYFVMPALVQYSQQYGDRQARLIEAARLAKFDEEQRIHNDGSFFSGRFTHGIFQGWPGEWETDAAGHLSVAYLLHTLKPPIPAATLEELGRSVNGTHVSEGSRHVMVRSDKRFASWSFKSYAGPLQGVLVGRHSEDLAEWNSNLYGRVEAEGQSDAFVVAEQWMADFPGGFAANMRVQEDITTPYGLHIIDDDGYGHRIVAATHPLFNQPNKTTNLDGARAYDTITMAGPGWTILARDENGNPSMLEARHGKGVLLVCQMNAEEMVYSASPGGREIFTNLLDYLDGAKPGARIALFGQENHAERALKVLRIPATRLTELLPALQPPGGYDLVILERSLQELRREWADVLAYVAAGGRVLKFLVQDNGWQEGLIAERDSVAVQHYSSVVALPDDMSLVKLDRLVAGSEIAAVTVYDLYWRVVNDIFNHNHRTVFSAEGQTDLVGVGGPERRIPIRSRWMNVDDLWGVIALDESQGMAVQDNNHRTAPRQLMASILAESLLSPARCYRPASGSYRRGEEIAQYGAWMMVEQAHGETQRLAKQAGSFRRVDVGAEGLLGVRVEATPGQGYLICANLSDQRRELKLPPELKLEPVDVADGNWLEAGRTRVWRVK